VGLNGFTNVDDAGPGDGGDRGTVQGAQRCRPTVIESGRSRIHVRAAAGEFGNCCMTSRTTCAPTSRPALACRCRGTLQTAIDFNNAHADVEMPFSTRTSSTWRTHFNHDRSEWPQDRVCFEATAPEGPLQYLARPGPGCRVSMGPGAEQFQLDAVVSATDNPAWSTDLVSAITSFLEPRPRGGPGYPIVAVPAGMGSACRLGISFLRNASAEPT